MPTFDFTSPDGKTYSVQGPEGATPEQAFQILQTQLGAGKAPAGAAPEPAPAPAAPITTNNVVRSTATGVPIVGGLLNKLDAATNATLAPMLNRFFDPQHQLSEENWSDRYAHSLRDQEGMDKKFSEEHPVVDTAAQLAGGVASMAPVMSAAPKAFGVTGKLSEMVRNGAISGAAVSGADALTRGHDPAESAITGGIIGGAAGPVGKAVGKGVAAIADRISPKPVVPQNVQRVAGVDIPLSEAEATGNSALSAEQQIMLRGGRGDRAQEVAEGFRNAQGEAVDQARGNISAALDPTGSAARTSPQDAAERVAAELIAAEQAEQAAQRANVAAVGREGDALARALDRSGTMRAPSAFDAGEQLSEREQHEFARHMQGLEEDLAAAGHGDLGPDVKKRAVKLMADERMSADDAVEHALHQLETEDAAAAAARGGFPGDRRAPAAAAAEPAGSGFTMRDVEQVRKQLSTLYGDARRAMMAGGSGADLHAIEAIQDAFDARVRQMVQGGKFAGDGPAVLAMQEEARAAFSDYKKKFAKRGSGDTIGAAVEKLLGKFSDTAATPDEVVRLAYGSGSAPGGQMPVQVAQRIANIFGKDSAEFATYKQGLFAQLTAGEPEKAAARIAEFLDGTKGKLLSQVAFDASERAQLRRYADMLNGIAPKGKEPGAAAAALRRITGADGAPPASTNDIVNYLYGSTGKGTNRVSVPLAAHLKDNLSPEGWAAVRQGMFEKLTNAGEGKIAFEAQALSQRLHEFLNESGSALAKTLYSADELAIMKQLAAVYKQMIPAKGTTNPSGTAPMLAKMAGGLRQSLLPLLGLTHGGLPGAAAAIGIDKGLAAIGNARQARAATKLFYGGQTPRAVNDRFAKTAGLVAQGSQPAGNQRR